MGKVNAGVAGQSRKIEPWVVAKAFEAVARAATVRTDDADDLIGEVATFDEAIEAEGRLLGQRLGARQEKNQRGLSPEIECPKLGVHGEEVEARAEGFDVVDDILTDQAHDFPERLARFDASRAREASKQRGGDRRVETREGFGRHAEPFRRLDRSTRVEPFGGFKPVAEAAGVVVKSEMLEHQRQRAGRRMIARELMMIEIVEPRLVAMTDVDDADGRIGEFGGRRFATDDDGWVQREQNTAREKLVGVSATRMGEKGVEREHEAGDAEGCRISGKGGSDDEPDENVPGSAVCRMSSARSKISRERDGAFSLPMSAA